MFLYDTSTHTSFQAFGSQIGTWTAFPDTVAALQILKKYYKLVILSNIDNESIARTVSGPLAGADFEAVYTAQNIGSYKPDLKNFEYLLKGAEKELGVKKEEVLHTAQSLTHDCVPAKVCVIGFLVDTDCPFMFMQVWVPFSMYGRIKVTDLVCFDRPWG